MLNMLCNLTQHVDTNSSNDKSVNTLHGWHPFEVRPYLSQIEFYLFKELDNLENK